SAKDVKELREQTGAGMMDCKKALQEADGNFDEAIGILRKKGQKLSEKRADREANQGLIVTRVSDDGHKAAALEINCETDFVARNEDFQQRAQQFLDLVFENELNSVDALLEKEVDGLPVADQGKDMVSQIGEKIEISRVVFATTEGEYIPYLPTGNQRGVHGEGDGSIEDAENGRDVALQVAAMEPIAATQQGDEGSTVEQEVKIDKEQLLNEGDSEDIAEKASQGKL